MGVPDFQEGGWNGRKFAHKPLKIIFTGRPRVFRRIEQIILKYNFNLGINNWLISYFLNFDIF
jgi:hypothetical protein